MTDPQRLLGGDADDFEKSLLRSARGDGPSPEARQRTLASLSLGAVLATSTSAATAAAPLLIGKWVLIGALVGGGALATVEVLTASPPRAPAPPTAPRASAAPPSLPAPALPAASAPATTLPEASAPAAALPTATAPAATAPATAAPTATATTVATALAAGQPTQPAPTAAPAQPAAAGSEAAAQADEDQLKQELRALDEARKALQQGNAAGALGALDRYAAAFPRGKLGTEALVLRINALLAQGDRTTATALAQRFIDQHPQSPHTPRLRALLGISEKSIDP